LRDFYITSLANANANNSNAGASGSTSGGGGLGALATMPYVWVNNTIEDISYTVAWGYSFSGALESTYNAQMTYGVVDPLDTLDEGWVDSGGRPDYNLLPSDWNVPYGNAFEWGNTGTSILLMDALADSSCSSFYWRGHGGPDMIGPKQGSEPSNSSHI